MLTTGIGLGTSGIGLGATAGAWTPCVRFWHSATFLVRNAQAYFLMAGWGSTWMACLLLALVRSALSHLVGAGPGSSFPSAASHWASARSASNSASSRKFCINNA